MLERERVRKETMTSSPSAHMLLPTISTSCGRSDGDGGEGGELPVSHPLKSSRSCSGFLTKWGDEDLLYGQLLLCHHLFRLKPEIQKIRIAFGKYLFDLL